MLCVKLTDTGVRREYNQDYVYGTTDSIGCLDNLFIVADGMGGHNAGDYASRCAVSVFTDYIESSEKKDTKTLFEEAVACANREVKSRADSDKNLAGMGTTFVCATIIEGVLYAANVGDSRLYLKRRDSFRQITVDHSLVEEMVQMGGIDRQSARKHPDKNIITRAVGAKRDIIIDYFAVPLMEGDVILMCTDGLTNMLEDEYISSVLQSGEAPEDIAEKLVKEANNAGGLDNISVIVIDPFAGEESSL